MGGTGVYPLLGGAGSCPSGGQSCVKGLFRGGWGLRATLSSLSADWWGCVSTLFIVWPEASHLWSLRAVGWGQVLVTKL